MYVYKFIRENGGWINWEMVEVDKFSCVDSNEALKHERHYIELLKATLNKVMPIPRSRRLRCDCGGLQYCNGRGN